MSLTRKQKEILDFVQASIAANGYAPTLREIGVHFGLSSVATVHKHMQTLVDKGMIVREGGRARGTELKAKPEASVSNVREVPLFGLIAAGAPIEALSSSETMSLPEDMLGRGETFVLKVKGNSMIEDHIMDGDFIIVEHREQAVNGEIVVALIESEATVKRFYREAAGQIRLQPANAALRPLYYSEDAVRVQGVVIGVLRKMRRN